eukprot:scaffold49857_cov71-Cyclotella_meneghiniana.AAC.9
MTKPSVVISGGGPSGLLTAILLNNIGVESTVIEKSIKADQWNSRSYTIVLGERGCAALEKAGLLGLAKETGTVKALPKKTSGIGFTRPSLVSFLEEAAIECPNITIERGAGAVSFREVDNDIKVTMEDGKTVSATHVLGADGKWSQVRQSFSSLSNQATVQTVPSFGVSMNAITIDGFKRDGTFVISPSKECMFYIIVSPRESEEAGFSLSMVCYDETLVRYPWLEPPTKSSRGWEDEYSAMPAGLKSSKSLAENLELLFQEELPAFYKVLDNNAFQSARVNRRVTWVKYTPGDEGEVTYATKHGRAALIGDAAHAMTPSMGEGCNCALESASRLVESVRLVMEKRGESVCSIESLSEGFLMYGSSRPKEVMPIQEQSAMRNHLTKDSSESKKSTRAQ